MHDSGDDLPSRPLERIQQIFLLVDKERNKVRRVFSLRERYFFFSPAYDTVLLLMLYHMFRISWLFGHFSL